MILITTVTGEKLGTDTTLEEFDMEVRRRRKGDGILKVEQANGLGPVMLMVDSIESYQEIPS